MCPDSARVIHCMSAKGGGGGGERGAGGKGGGLELRLIKRKRNRREWGESALRLAHMHDTRTGTHEQGGIRRRALGLLQTTP